MSRDIDPFRTLPSIYEENPELLDHKPPREEGERVVQTVFLDIDGRDQEVYLEKVYQDVTETGASLENSVYTENEWDNLFDELEWDESEETHHWKE